MIKSKTCSIEGCNNPVWSKGLCKNHTKGKSLPRKSKQTNTTIKILPDTPEIANKYAMMEFFDSLWNKQPKPRKCQSCGKKIYGENLSIYHHHIIPKSQNEEFKFDKRNMMFVCGECHELIEKNFPTKKAKEIIKRVKRELLKSE